MSSPASPLVSCKRKCACESTSGGGAGGLRFAISRRNTFSRAFSSLLLRMMRLLRLLRGTPPSRVSCGEVEDGVEVDVREVREGGEGDERHGRPSSQEVAYMQCTTHRVTPTPAHQDGGEDGMERGRGSGKREEAGREKKREGRSGISAHRRNPKTPAHKKKSNMLTPPPPPQSVTPSSHARTLSVLDPSSEGCEAGEEISRIDFFSPFFPYLFNP